MAWGLLAASLVQLLACASFASVARVLAVRFARGDEAGAVRAFATAWACMSAYMAIRGVLGLAASQGWTPLGPFVAGHLLTIPLVCAAAWGIAYYVAYLYTGLRGLRVLFGAYFVVVGLAYALASVAARPSRVVVGEWAPALEPRIPWIDAIYLAFGIPMLVATTAYLSLVTRRLQPIQKYRVALVSSSLLAWIGSGLATSIAGDQLGAFLAITVLGIFTAGAVFLAYRPPVFVLRRLAPEAIPDPARRVVQARADDFARRMSELV